MCHLPWVQCLNASCSYQPARTTPRGARVVPGELQPCGQLCPPDIYTNAVKNLNGQPAWEMCAYCLAILETDPRDDALLLQPTVQVGLGGDTRMKGTFAPQASDMSQQSYQPSAVDSIPSLTGQAGRPLPQQGFVEETEDVDMTQQVQQHFESLTTEDPTFDDLRRDPVGVYKALSTNGPRMGKQPTHSSLNLLLRPDALYYQMGQPEEPKYKPPSKRAQFPVVKLHRGTPSWLHNNSTCVKLPNGEVIPSSWVRYSTDRIEEDLFHLYLNSLDLEDNAKLRVPLLGEELTQYKLRQKRNVRPNEADEALDIEYKAWATAIHFLMPAAESWLPPRQRSAEFWASRETKKGKRSRNGKTSGKASVPSDAEISSALMPPPPAPKPRWPFPPYGKPKHQLPPGFSSRWDLTTLPSGQVLPISWIKYSAAKVEESLEEFYKQLRGLEENRKLSCPIMGELMDDFKTRQWKSVRPAESEAVLFHEYVNWIDMDPRERGFHNWWIPEADRKNVRVRMNEAFYQSNSGPKASRRPTQIDAYGVKPIDLIGAPPEWFEAHWAAVQLRSGQVIPRGWVLWTDTEIKIRAKDAYEKCNDLADNDFVMAPLLGESRNRYRQRQWEKIRILEDIDTLNREYDEWIEQLPGLTPAGAAWLTAELQQENEIDANPPSIFTAPSPAPAEASSSSAASVPSKPWTYYTVQLLCPIPSWLPTNFRGLSIPCTRLRSGQIVPEFWRNIRSGLSEDELATYYQQGLTMEKNSSLAAPLLGETLMQYKKRQWEQRPGEKEEVLDSEFSVYADQMLKELAHGESGDWWLWKEDKWAKIRRGKQKA